MYSSFNILSIILITCRLVAIKSLETNIRGCPDRCSCVDNLVDCNQASLQRVPSVIPARSITLLLQNNLLESTKLTVNSGSILGIPIYLPWNNPFAKLAYIDLSHNALKHLDGKLFSYTNQLKKLILDDNYLNNLQDNFDAFKFLKKLRELSIRNNRISKPLTYLPLSNFYNLTKLDLTNNQIQHINSNAFNNLLLLTELRLGRNRIHSLPSGCFAMLRNLRFLDLSYNKLTDIDPRVFGSLHQLVTLILSNNNIRGMPGNIGWSSLRELRLSHNEITEVDPQILVQLKRLKYFDVSNNPLKHIPETQNKNLLIVEASDNTSECSCATWKGAETMRDSDNKTCTVENNYTILYDVNTNECVICTHNSQISLSELQYLCEATDTENTKVTIVAASTTAVVVILLLLVVLIIVFKRRKASKQHSGTRQQAGGMQKTVRPLMRLSLRNWTNRGITMIRNTLRQNIPPTATETERNIDHLQRETEENADLENIYDTIERQTSLELPNPNKSGEYNNKLCHEIPNSKVTSVNGTCANKHSPGRGTDGRIRIAGIVAECINKNNMEDKKYYYSTGQSIPTSHRLPKPVPRAGIIMTPTTNRPFSKNNLFVSVDHRYENDPEAYEIPISSDNDSYLELNSDMK